MRVSLLAVLVLAVAVCVLAYDAPQIEVKFGSRTFYVVNPQYPTNPSPGLILWYHGHGQWCLAQNEWCDKWQANLKKIGLNFMCASICGENGGWDNGGNKDIDLSKQVIDYMQKNYNIDKSKVFASGWSEGAMFTVHLVCATGTSVVQGINPHCCAGTCNTVPFHYLGYDGMYDNVCAGSAKGSWESFVKANGCNPGSGNDRQLVCKGKQYELHVQAAPHMIMDYTVQGPAWIARALGATPTPVASNCGITANEGDSLTLGCDDGEAITEIAFASYGTPTGDCAKGFAKSACDSNRTEEVVAKACVGKKTCTVAGNNDNFGDPCVGTGKKLAVQATCVPTADVTCGVAAEGASLKLSCANGKKINAVTFASYGLPQGSCPNNSKGSCHADKSQSVVEAACLGKATCTLAATNDAFGDPCVGTGKQLAAVITCA